MRQLDDFLEKHYKSIFCSLAGLCVVLYVFLLGGDTVWTDEAYTFAMIKHPFSDIWRITAADVHPPLYYWYLKTLTSPFSYSLLSAKIASILPYVFIMIFGGRQLKKLFNSRTSILFMGMFFCFPSAMAYSIEVRMYSLAAAFVFACAIFAYRFWKYSQVRDGIGFVVSGVGAAYTHYFAFVSIIIVYGLLLIAIIIEKRALFKKWLVFVLLSVLVYAPWLSEFYNQLVYKVQNEYWIERISIGTVFDYWRTLFGAAGFGTYALFFSLAYLVSLIWIIRCKGKKSLLLVCLCCLAVPIGTLVVGIGASILIRPVFVIRYLIPSVPLLVTFMAIVLGEIDNSMIFTNILVVVLMGGISNYGVTLYSEYTTHDYLPVSQYEVDAYIATENSHVARTLGYYVTDVPIYCGKLTAANPDLNLREKESFDKDMVQKAIILLKPGEIPSGEYSDWYDYEFLGQWKCETDTDAFLLIRKEENS